LEEGLKLIQVKNNNLRQYTKERKAKKKRKQNVLFTKLVFTLKVVRELAATKEAA